MRRMEDGEWETMPQRKGATETTLQGCSLSFLLLYVFIFKADSNYL